MFYNIKKFSILLILSTLAHAANVEIAQLPQGSAASTTSQDVAPFVNATLNQTQKINLWDLINLPPMVSTYAPLASPIFSGTVEGSGAFEIGGSCTIGSAAPALASSILDLESTTQGFLPPRMTTTQRNAISSPANGLIVYNTTTNQLNVYNSGASSWVSAGGGGISYAADTGTANSYAIAPTSPATGYNAGDSYSFLAGHANTGASTLAVSGLSTKAITEPGQGATVTGDILANQIITVVYDGTQFQMISPQGPASSSNSASTIVKRDASGNFSAGTMTASLNGNATSSTTATSATTATNLASGVANDIPYQTGAGATAYIAPVNSAVMVTNGSGVPSESTTLPAVSGANLTGTASALTAGTVTTNANLTGPITSSGNATSIAAQVGTGTTFAMSASPTFTGTVGGANATFTGTVKGAPLQATATGVIFPDSSTQATSAVTNLLTNPNFQNATVTTGWTTGGSGLAVTADTTNYLGPGTQSALLTFTSSTTGTFSQTITPANIALYAGVNMMAQVWVKTSLSTVQVCALISGATSGCVAAPSGNTFQPVTVNFPANSSTTSFGIQIQTTGASTTGTVNAQFAYMGSATNLGLGQLSQDSTSYTPTLSGGGIGTPTNISFDYLRVGERLYVTGTATAGTVAGSLVPVPLPTPLLIDTTKMAVSATTSNPGQQVGWFYAGTTANHGGPIIASTSTSTSQVYLGGLQSSSAMLTPANGSTTLTSSELVSFKFDVPIVGWTGNQAGYRSDVTPASYSAKLNNTGGSNWTVTASTQSDFSTSSITSTLTQVTNRNFGTPVANASNLPGITLTFPRAGNYQICVEGGAGNTSGNGSNGLYLTDGTTTIANVNVSPNAANGQIPYFLCGIYTASASSVTIKLQGQTNTGTLNLGPNNSSYAPTMWWTFVELDAPMPAPYLVGSVLNRSTNYANYLDAAVVTCSSSSSIGSQLAGTSWISAIGNISSGVCALTVSGYTAQPYCWSDLSTATQNQELTHATASSTTNVNLSCTDNSTIGTACTTFTANVFCLGQH